MTRKTVLNTLFSTASIAFIFLVWQIYAISVNNPILMPDPFMVIKRFIELLQEQETYRILFTSLSRLLLSLLLATGLGMFFGLFSAINDQVEAFFKPIIVAIRTLPVISIIVVILIIFGNVITLYIISLLLLFPIIYQAELDGIRNIDSLLIDVLKLETNDINKDVVKHVYFPLSIPFLRTALIDAVGLGFKVLVVAEYIAQTQTSIGREIYMSKVNLDFTSVFAWTLMLLVFVLVIEIAVQKSLKQ
jgi:NitT/TauT family transport system permease protein